VRRWLKWLLARLPGVSADVVIAVSDFVARRQVTAALTPAQRVTRVWNGLALPASAGGRDRPLHAALGLPAERPVIACACRAAEEKGVTVLLEAFDLLLRDWPEGGPRPLLVYMGDGPHFAQIQACRDRLAAKPDIILTGYRRDAGSLMAGADVCAMPSVWQDALPLAVMQPMALGLPVVASAVGGIPEMIVDGESGLLVPPADPASLAATLTQLVRDPELRRRLGAAARARVERVFAPEPQIAAITTILAPGFATGAAQGV
jgi:glycosyltransferase involved in cell wall biosynthesis